MIDLFHSTFSYDFWLTHGVCVRTCAAHFIYFADTYKTMIHLCKVNERAIWQEPLQNRFRQSIQSIVSNLHIITIIRPNIETIKKSDTGGVELKENHWIHYFNANCIQWQKERKQRKNER